VYRNQIGDVQALSPITPLATDCQPDYGLGWNPFWPTALNGGQDVFHDCPSNDWAMIVSVFIQELVYKQISQVPFLKSLFNRIHGGGHANKPPLFTSAGASVAAAGLVTSL
jgi:hypothetical protein